MSRYSPIYNLISTDYTVDTVYSLAFFINDLATEGKALTIHIKDRKILDIDIEATRIYNPELDIGSPMNESRLKTVLVAHVYPGSCTIQSKVENNKIKLTFYITKSATL